MVLLRMHTYLEAVRERQLQKRSLCGERKRLKMKENGGQKLTINDVAEQLGVSTSTVSRAISGKGRIGSATRKRVLDFIEEHDYHPNSSAKSLAQSKTNNIAILIPEVSTLVAQPFFYMCMCGVNEVALDIDMFYDKDKDEYYCIRCQYVGNEEDVLKRNEVVRMKYGSMMKRYKMEDF